MTLTMTRSRLRLAGSAAVVVASAALLAVAMSGGPSVAATGHSRASHSRPALSAAGTAANVRTARYPVQPFAQEFSMNTSSFCPAGSGNTPCDGAAGDYGTIDRVASHFSDGGAGNYAPGTPALTGGWMAVVDGTGVANQGIGCPGTTSTSNPGEDCSGPYALFGTGKAMGVENVFPAGGFTVTNDLYLSPATSGPAGSLVDDDVELNNNLGQYGSDNIITACAEDTASSALGFVVNFGHGSPGSCSGTPVITTAGWYRFVFVFSDKGGDAYVAESVRSEATGNVVASTQPEPVGGGNPSQISNWGGPGYFWLPTEDFSGLPLANFALQSGQVIAGHRP